jgi:hypothetical protein
MCYILYYNIFLCCCKVQYLVDILIKAKALVLNRNYNSTHSHLSQLLSFLPAAAVLSKPCCLFTRHRRHRNSRLVLFASRSLSSTPIANFPSLQDRSYGLHYLGLVRPCPNTHSGGQLHRKPLEHTGGYGRSGQKEAPRRRRYNQQSNLSTAVFHHSPILAPTRSLYVIREQRRPLILAIYRATRLHKPRSTPNKATQAHKPQNRPRKIYIPPHGHRLRHHVHLPCARRAAPARRFRPSVVPCMPVGAEA